MKTKELENSFNVLYDFICTYILALVWSLIKALYNGIREFIKNRCTIYLIIFILVTIISIVILALKIDFKKFYVFGLYFTFFFILGLKWNIKAQLNIHRSKVFEQINFKSRAGIHPVIIKRQKKTNNREVLTIKSMIPLKSWQDNKETLETAFNSKVRIITTKQKQIIKLILLGGN